MNQSAPSVVDDIFATEEKLLGTLVSIRNAALPAEEKAAIRDMILDYAGTDDSAKRSELKNEISRRLNLKPSSSTKTPETVSIKPNVAPTVGRSRPTPSFSAALPKPIKPEPPIEKPAVYVAPSPKPPTVEKVAAVAPIAKISEAPKVSEPPKIVPTPAPQNTKLKDRINEIKHDINNRVGNPVNLISADETIGREYMAALLDAMKRASVDDASAAAALSRLENSYQKVNQLLASKDLTKKAPSAPLPSTAPKSAPPLPPRPTQAEPPKPTASPANKNSSLLSSLSQKDKAVGDTLSKLKSVAPITNVVNKSEQHKVTVKSAETKKTATFVDPEKLTPVSTITALPEQIDTLRQKSIDREVEDKKPITDLDNEKVTAGLKQLLSEWRLFRGKGWFGAGLSGMDHPLYKELANLSMAAVVAGRFEGATPEVKHLLSDYMNGWRYEQGIVHQMGESFEHYLRRVILHIIERQHDLRSPDQNETAVIK